MKKEKIVILSLAAAAVLLFVLMAIQAERVLNKPPLLTIGGEEIFVDDEYLTLSGCDSNDMTVLEKLTNLKHLEWDNASDISAIAGLTKLEYLELQVSKTTDISALQGLKKLKELKLNGNPLQQSQIDELQAALPNCDIIF